MAFNPFTTFQKNKGFWMAAMTLLAMITFIFCSGGNDMVEKFLYMWRSHGPTVVSVNSQNLSNYDLSRLRDQRTVVNDFMRRCCNATVDNINRGMEKFRDQPEPTEEKKRKERAELIFHSNEIKAVLLNRMRQPHYFAGGTKFDDLVEFKLWEAQADKLNVRIDEEFEKMLRLEFFAQIADDQINRAWMEAKAGKEMTDPEMRRAVTGEFRVRLARLAMLEMRPSLFFAKDQQIPVPDPSIPIDQRLQVSLARLADVFKDKRAEFTVTLIPIAVEDFKREVAKEKPPANDDLQRLFEKYHKVKYDPASPLPSFETPAEVKVEYIMADPTSPIYMAAARAKMVLDETLPAVGNPLQSSLVTLARCGGMVAAREKEAQDILDGLGLKKYDIYGAADIGSSHFIWPLGAYLAERNPQAIASLIGNVAAGCANPAETYGCPIVQGAAAWAGFLAEPTVRQPELIEAGITAESKRRVLPSARVAVSGATGQPLDVILSVMNNLKLADVPGQFAGQGTPAQVQQFRDIVLRRESRLLLPLPIVEPELRQIMLDRTAETWASRNLMTVKRVFDQNTKPEMIKKLVRDFVPKYNLKHEITKHWHSRYDIDKAPSLQPLREAYDKYYQQINAFEGRITPERMLKDGDFYKLFFDNERFASTSKYAVRPWPPDIFPSQTELMGMPGAVNQAGVTADMLMQVDQFVRQRANPSDSFRLLDKAQKPILFWRQDEKAPEFPKDLAAARPRVVDAWETERAREDKAIPLAKNIADALVAGSDFNPLFIDALTVKTKHQKIVLHKIAPLVPKIVGDRSMGGYQDYFPYTLPKDTLVLPREDTVKDLLALNNLSAPIEVKTGLGVAGGEPAFVKKLNDLNKALFEEVKKANPKAAANPHGPEGKFVQILTNKPQTMYYVAVVTRPPTPNLKEFEGDVLRFASEHQMRFVDRFMTRAQEMAAKDFHAALIAQMIKEFKVEFTDREEARKTFDKDDHS